ncbi:MAG: mechanosensitive ion channel [Desulfuromonadaceae bacterium]|nr:mechanosensitive ion channel [Desulfuromonadaceae bacterium]
MTEDILNSLMAILNLEIIIETALVVLITSLFVFGLHRLFDFLAVRFPRHRVQISSTFPILRLLVWFGIILLIVTMVIRPEMNTLVALSATVGVAFGLGSQELVKNVLAGVMVLIDRPFRVGDMIRVNSFYGEVVQIGLATSRIHTFDDSIISIPNGLLLNTPVSNSNSGELTEQVVIEFSLPAHIDVGEIKELMEEAALCSPYVYRKKPVVVLVEDRFDYCFLSHFKVKAYVMDVRFERLIASDITERIKADILSRDILPKNFPMPWGTSVSGNTDSVRAPVSN